MAPPPEMKGEKEAKSLLDKDQDGTLSASELRDGVKRFDRNKDGRVERREVFDTLKSEGERTSLQMVAAIAKRLAGVKPEETGPAKDEPAKDAPQPEPEKREQPRAKKPEPKPEREEDTQVSRKMQRAVNFLLGMDRNRNAYIDQRELRSGIRRVGGMAAANRIMDLDGDGKVERGEVMAVKRAAMEEFNERSGKGSGRRFAGRKEKPADLGAMDSNGDGRLDKEEATALLKKLDKDEDGKVTMHEAMAGKTGMNIKQLGQELVKAGIEFKPDGRGKFAAVVPDGPVVAKTQEKDTGRT